LNELMKNGWAEYHDGWISYSATQAGINEAKAIAGRGDAVRGRMLGRGGDVDAPEVKKWDVFISHAEEDKVDVVEPLAEALRGRRYRVWCDRSALAVGDSLRQHIDKGLAESRFGVVVLSPSFFGKRWVELELDGLVQKESGGQKVILPVWHRVTRELVANYSLSLAGKVGVATEGGIGIVADKLHDAIRRSSDTGAASPLIREKDLPR
jgi:hypothetical protein